MIRDRDPFIDGVRSVAIVRVLLLHLFMWIEMSWIGTFSYFMPGMPLVFFISGALASQSLRSNGWAERRRFWWDRARRIFLPFWAFAALAVATCVIADLAIDDHAYDYAWERAWAWVVPLAGPRASAGLDRLVWHLWFMSSLILMLGSAPLTVALHRRWPWSGAIAFASIAVLLAVLRIETFNVLHNALLFGAAFQLGYGYSDDRLKRVHPGWLLAAGGALFAFALGWHLSSARGSMVHTIPLAHVSLGLAFVAFWLALRGPASRLFELPWFVELRRRVNPRAYTIFLWGPIANEIAWRCVGTLESGKLAAYIALSLVLLYGAIRAFGPIEDLAARRARKLTPVPSEPATEERRAA